MPVENLSERELGLPEQTTTLKVPLISIYLQGDPVPRRIMVNCKGSDINLATALPDDNQMRYTDVPSLLFLKYIAFQ
ncbi:MAG: hypothetical protein M1529_05585 [Candidatus Thermoplasmatota archaeon]|nr:hypothetical protein [Candidatus Thermoplasmatota archaeon]